MKINHNLFISGIAKVMILLIFLLVTVASNPRAISFVVVNKNQNLDKMVALDLISYDKGEIIKDTQKIIEIASDLLETTNDNLDRLSLYMDLGKPSGFSLEQFKIALFSSDKIYQDKYDIIKDNVEFFYDMEQKYGINGIFVMSIAVHESNWGTSSVAINNKNLFGYRIFVSPGKTEYRNFNTYEECIETVSKTLTRQYLHPKGTIIPALPAPTTSHNYFGPTVIDVNKRYAGDPNWHKKIYNYIVHFYNNIDSTFN